MRVLQIVLGIVIRSVLFQSMPSKESSLVFSSCSPAVQQDAPLALLLEVPLSLAYPLNQKVQGSPM